MHNSVKISSKEKVFYGLGDFSANILLVVFSFYLLFFMVSIGGLKPAFASLVFLTAKIWDAVTDVWMGRISDNTKSKFGKRRVYMIFGAIPFGLMFIILWLCPFSVETSQFVKFIYYMMAYCLFNTTYTIVYVPYNAQEAGAIGAALVVAAGIKGEDVLDLASRLVKANRVYVPDTKNKEVYERNYSVFKNLYKSNTANFKKLNS